MNRTPMRALVAFAIITSTFAAGSAAKPVDPGSAAAEHQRIIDFWTNERVAQAIPRDFVKTGPGRYEPVAKPDKPGKPGGGGSGGGGTVTGASWNGGGLVAETTGKVLFEMSGSYYVCSASLVADSKPGRSIVLTAAHCVYDEAGEAFATNWMFIPNYDAAPAPLTTSGTFCGSTKWGCWTATGLVAHSGYTSAGGFNDQAVVYDFGFAVLGNGGKSDGQADALGAQEIAFDDNAENVTVYAFGYPAAKKYRGNDLVYCAGPTGFDPLMANQTYKIACNMTGGSSGGPWMREFSPSTGAGVLTSVNSYGYSGDNSMHGPKFNSDTEAAFDLATGAGSGIVP